jgi:hypothetical protein
MTEWTEEWPTERGWYWFLGQTSKMMWDREPEKVPVRVHRDATGKPVHVGGGRFLYKGEGARGLWTRMVMPDPPTDFQIEKVLT